uniref:Uncharacterized protein n=1 Tax=Gouania willdenowi TaxID=441366 RepID=A0A8C5GB85_GOUWI
FSKMRIDTILMYLQLFSGVFFLQMYSDAKSYSITGLKGSSKQKTSVRKVVCLSDCLSVAFAPKQPCPAGCSPFYINTTKCTYILASSTSQEWLKALCHLAFQPFLHLSPDWLNLLHNTICKMEKPHCTLTLK